MGVIDCIEALGLRICNLEDGASRVARPRFRHRPSAKLYKVKISGLFHKLDSDNEGKYTRSDPLLFDKELDLILAQFGPEIWPDKEPRPHLRVPDATSRYDRNLYYPQDKEILKVRIREVILAKRPSQKASLSTPTAKRARYGNDDDDYQTKSTGKLRRPYPTAVRKRATRTANCNTDIADDFDDDSGLGRRLKRRQILSPNDFERIPSSPTIAQPVENPSNSAKTIAQTKLYVFSKPWSAHGAMTLEGCDSAEQFFDKAQSLVSDNPGSRSEEEGLGIYWMKIELPEDMSSDRSLLIKKDAQESGGMFSLLRDILRFAPAFPSGTGRTLEGEVGFSEQTDV